MKSWAAVLVLLFLTACADSGRYHQRSDSKPRAIRADIDFANVTPAFEPYAKATLRPYTVLGKRYQPLKTGKGYSAEGIASWYGQKFHGHLTANGEVYDMFTLSAAHKTLPLPSFVRVTNLANGRQAVLRVNDRGPFHDDRLIDLSYAAALKLDVISTGTARVKVDVIHIDEQGVTTVGNQPIAPSPVEDKQQALFIQVAALGDENRVRQIATGLASLYQTPAHTPVIDGLYRVRLGPFADKARASALLTELRQNGYHNAYTLYAAP